MTAPKIVVVGSANMDIIVQTPRIPSSGETIIGGSSQMSPGGKGANQAVAAARLGADVCFIGKIGTDQFGDLLKISLDEFGVNTDYVIRSDTHPTGIALICVSSSTGDNSIVVAPNANAQLTIEEIAAIEPVIASAQTVVCSLEVPLPAVERAIAIAKQHGVRTVLNPAPAAPLPISLLKLIDLLTPNEHEVLQLAPGSSLVEEAARTLINQGVETVIVTLGAQGALLMQRDDNGNVVHVPAVKPEKVIDTTGAGDCYTAAVAVAISQGADTVEALRFAATAASLIVTKAGAMPAMPTREEVHGVTPHAPAK